MALYVRRSTQVGRRGAPAKGVGRVTGARVQISPSPEKKTSERLVFFVFGKRFELERRGPAREGRLRPLPVADEGSKKEWR